MNEDLRIIKKKYGEDMMHLCRKLFPTILEEENKLSTILLQSFYPNNNLCQDIINNNLITDFTNYILRTQSINTAKKSADKTPEELLRQAHYTLYECHTEEEIQSFTKYYQPKERLCTFRTNRLNDCYVFFAVKDNADSIKREDFTNPKRQDEYGTSVISIQFTRDPTHMLSIKNRYNHIVSNPDATFSNNLDNIIPGLTLSFEKYYGMKQKYISSYLDIPNYVLANDGRLYKYNYEINNIYYCPDNIVIDNFEVKKYPKEKYLITDYFIIDLVNKTISLYDENTRDTFPSTISNIKNIVITNTKDGKKVVISLVEGQDIVLTLDKDNKLISIEDSNIINVPSAYLLRNKYLVSLKLTNAQTMGDNVLYTNKDLTNLDTPYLEEIGSRCLYHNIRLEELNLPRVKSIGNAFMYLNDSLERISIPLLEQVGNSFLYINTKVNELDIPLLNFDNMYLNILLEESTRRSKK